MLNFKSVYYRAVGVYQKVSNSLGEIQEQENIPQNFSEKNLLLLQKIKNIASLGYVIHSNESNSFVESFFENSDVQKFEPPPKLPRCVPAFKSELDLKPLELKSFGDKGLLFVHFWLDSEREVSLIMGLDRKLTDLQDRLLHTRHLIQRLYYD